jgi:hypothetical protein
VQEVALLLDHVRVALCPGMTALGLIDTLTVVLGAGCGVGAETPPPPQLERTKELRKTKTRKTHFRVTVGDCISPPFTEQSKSSCGLNESSTE